jgi:hypothetical protein
MKNIILLLLLSFGTLAQEKKNLKIFKFHPISLVSGSLNLSQEIFNKELSKSFLVGIGVRYLNLKDIYSYQYGSSSSPINQFNKWQGATLSLERRIYVSGFKEVDKNILMNQKGFFGLYFSGGTKLEYNYNYFDNSRIISKYDPKTSANTEISIIDKGKVKYMGILPNINIGIQITLFQNLYTDINFGGGIRFLNKNIVSFEKNTYENFYSDSLALETINSFVIQEGVQPNFNFTLGFKL